MELFLRIIQAVLLYGALLGIIYLLWLMFENRKRLTQLENKQFTLLEILVPKNNERGPLAAENLFAALHGMLDISAKVQDRISFEIISKNQAIKFYVYVPSHLKDFIEGQIYAQYPTVEITEVPDYTHEMHTGIWSGSDLLLNKNDVFPIKMFDSFEVDPLASITSVLSKIGIGEEIWIQMVLSPVPDTWQQKGISYIKAIRDGQNPNGTSMSGSVMKGVISLAGDVVKTATRPPDTTSKVEKKDIKLSGPEETALKGIETKVAKLGFTTKIRILSLSDDELTAKSKVTSIVSAFKQFNMTNLNGFSSSLIVTDPAIMHRYRNREIGERAYILNIQEIASIYHLPSEAVATPSIAWAGSKKGEPPANLPIEGMIPAGELTLFAQTNFRHYTYKFGIKEKDRGLHFYAIGKTGTGKSTLLENMIIDDIRQGRGVAVVDPHGDLIDHVLDFIPNERMHEVVYFAPADRNFPIGFNVLENVDPDLKSVVASGVVGIFKKIFGDSWGPRLEYILRNAVIALLDYPNATMLGITQIFVDKAYRADVVSHITDPVIKHFWTNEFEKYDQKFRTEAVAPIQNKVGQFLSSSTIRNIVGQPKSTISLNDIMDTKKILLLDLSVGKIGEDTAALLGAMMITKIQLSAMSRASIPEAQRINFYLYVDEFQNFATDSFATILSEARKYKLNLIMTNQYIAQMPEIVQSAVFGNVGTIVSFRVGAQDASALIKEFEPVFEANDMVNLDNYNVYVKMAIDGVTSPAFSSVTLPPYTDTSNNREEIISFSRSRYSVDREKVEEVINQSAEFSMQNTPEADAKPKYPRQYDQQYLELRDPETGEIFYTPGILEEVKDTSNKEKGSDSPQKAMVKENAEEKLPVVIPTQTILPDKPQSHLGILAQSLGKAPHSHTQGQGSGHNTQTHSQTTSSVVLDDISPMKELPDE